MNISLPLFRYPTLVVLVDDSASFVSSLAFHVGAFAAVQPFHDAQDALQALQAACRGGNKLLPFRVGYDEQTLSSERRTIALDIDHIYRLVMNPHRFLESAVIVVDYAMPQMNGVEFCHALKDLPCKKILFTGEADEMVAVEAFNAGVIDRYLKKSDPQVLERLAREIAVLERQYFVEKSETLRDLLGRHSFSFISDPAFSRLIDELSQANKFVEYYLFSNPAGILFVNAAGKMKLMVVETQSGMISHLEAAQDYGAPQPLQDALRSGTIVPFFWKSGGMYTELSADWEQYCRPAQVCAGREDYLWALFELPELFLDQPIYSYGRFLLDRARAAGR